MEILVASGPAHNNQGVVAPSERTMGSWLGLEKQDPLSSFPPYPSFFMTIRKATPDDARVLATLLLSAMEDIVYGFIGEKDREKAAAFLFHFARLENNQYSYQNCRVVEKADRVVAAVNVYDGAHLHELRRPVLHYLYHQLHVPVQSEDETGAGEIYIDSLAVDPAEQGKGFGSAILANLIDEYVKRRRQTLGLLVEESNPAAKRLYLRTGFTVKGTKQIFGKNMAHLQLGPAREV